MNRAKLTAAGIVLPVALIAALLGFLLFDEDQAACIPAGAAVVVDPGSVPAGPVAGFSGEQLTCRSPSPPAARCQPVLRKPSTMPSDY